MKALSYLCFALALVAIVCFVGCGFIEKAAGGGAAVLKEAAPLLPPPWGVLAGVAASGLGMVAQLAASHVKGAALATNASPHPIADFLSSHYWIWQAITAAVGTANAMGWIHVSPTELGTLAAGLGLVTVTQVAADTHADNQAPAPAASTKT